MSTTADALRAYFSERFGEVTDAAVVTDKLTGRSRRFGFITFAHGAHADAACAATDEMLGGYFEQFGEVKEASVKRKPDGTSRSFGICSFALEDAVDSVCTAGRVGGKLFQMFTNLTHRRQAFRRFILGSPPTLSAK